MIRISKRYTFEAAHHLPLHNGKCRNVHGHSYKVDVVLRGDRTQGGGPSSGMLVDFDVLDEIAKPVIQALDHTDLNVVLGDIGGPPTAENIARHIFIKVVDSLAISAFADVDVVRVWETEKCWAEYTRD